MYTCLSFYGWIWQISKRNYIHKFWSKQKPTKVLAAYFLHPIVLTRVLYYSETFRTRWKHFVVWIKLTKNGSLCFMLFLFWNSSTTFTYWGSYMYQKVTSSKHPWRSQYALFFMFYSRWYKTAWPFRVHINMKLCARNVWE